MTRKRTLLARLQMTNLKLQNLLCIVHLEKTRGQDRKNVQDEDETTGEELNSLVTTLQGLALIKWLENSPHLLMLWSER